MNVYIKQQALLVVILLLINAVGAVAAERTELRIPKARGDNDSAHQYFTELLQRALRKGADGRMVPALVNSMDMAPQRSVRELKLGRTIDVLWMGASQERARDLLVIPVPLERGLVGYRQLIVRKNQLTQFDKVSNIQDLTQFKACIGSQWVDAEIFKHARLPVVTSIGHENLFKQLVVGRCDYFPRAVHEAKIEMVNRINTYPDLVIYNGLMLHYPFAVYFFVHPDNKALAAWLQRGLERMIDDGELMEFMRSHPHTKLAFPLTDFSEQRWLMLANDTLPGFTDESNSRYWFQHADFILSPKL